MKKQTILITGAATGIGRATLERLLMRGKYHLIAAVETAEQLKLLNKEENTDVEILKLDVTQPKDRDVLMEKNIDILIHNAGVGYTGSLYDVPLEKIRHNFEVNLFGILEINKLLLPKMVERGRGRIIAISSIAGRIPLPFFGPYNMTKYALSVGMEDLRNELESIESGVSVSVVEPGAYHTGFNQQMVETRREYTQKDSPFYPGLEKRIQKDLKQFELLEVKNLDSIVRQIVKAIEDDKPKFRYTAPWWQSLGVQLLRIFGK
jgi:short-subunit dehydrogenase